MSFGGDANNYGPTTIYAPVTINPPHADTLTYTGPSPLTQGAPATLSATLQDAGTSAAIDGQTLTFIIGPAQNAQTCTGTTAGASGTAIVHHPVGQREQQPGRCTSHLRRERQSQLHRQPVGRVGDGELPGRHADAERAGAEPGEQRIKPDPVGHADGLEHQRGTVGSNHHVHPRPRRR